MNETNTVRVLDSGMSFYERVTEKTEAKLHELRELATQGGETPLETWQARARGVFILWDALVEGRHTMTDFENLMGLVEEDWPVRMQQG